MDDLIAANLVRQAPNERHWELVPEVGAIPNWVAGCVVFVNGGKADQATQPRQWPQAAFVGLAWGDTDGEVRETQATLSELREAMRSGRPTELERWGLGGFEQWFKDCLELTYRPACNLENAGTRRAADEAP
jgi:hypothetical protein